MTSWLDCCIDVSHWSNCGEEIDWAAVDPAILLVFAKATQGTSYVDPSFAKNKDGALASGRMFVPYHFMDGSDRDDQIDNFWPHLDKGKPFALDWEGRASQTASPEDAEYIGERLSVSVGCRPVGYWGIPGSTPAMPTDPMKNWVRWVPRYPIVGARSIADLPTDRLSMIAAPFWQYTSQGRVAGIKGYVDRTLWNGTEDELDAWYGAP